ncbi:MAG: hypothetical protein E6778_18730 [Niallia nealsonii]|nr:hypothetical protein [Niallia nealsonii]
MTQNQIIKKWMSTPTAVTRKQYLDSKRSLSSTAVVLKFYTTPGFSIELFLTTKKWFDTVIMPGQKSGLNIQGYMRLIAM